MLELKPEEADVRWLIDIDTRMGASSHIGLIGSVFKNAIREAINGPRQAEVHDIAHACFDSAYANCPRRSMPLDDRSMPADFQIDAAGCLVVVCAFQIATHVRRERPRNHSQLLSR
jgi:hypothetical protein